MGLGNLWGVPSKVRGGRPVQILRTRHNGSWELDEKALHNILMDDRIKEKPVAVVSVAGAFRTGKSFLLNFFIRYMRSGGRVDWIGGPEERLEGFSWRGGCDRDTTGIVLWDEVFLVTTTEGKELAVLLMDTQGTFDCESSTRRDTVAFALSILITSVQVYNLSTNISASDLQYLQYFTEYGRMAQKAGNETPFQKLLFLVRDWSYIHDAPYGAEGGRIMLKKRLEITKSLPREQQQLRKHIQSCFSDINCFLMPHPGDKVTKDTSFDGRIADIGVNFKKNLQDLVPLVLTAKHLPAKLIHGQEVTCEELASYINTFTKAFAGNELPEPKSLLEATAEANNLVAKDDAKTFYMARMEEVIRRGISNKNLQETHDRLLNEAIDLLRSRPKMAGAKPEYEYLDELEKNGKPHHLQLSMERLVRSSWLVPEDFLVFCFRTPPYGFNDGTSQEINCLYAAFRARNRNMGMAILKNIMEFFPAVLCACAGLPALVPSVSVPGIITAVSFAVGGVGYGAIWLFKKLWTPRDVDFARRPERTRRWWHQRSTPARSEHSESTEEGSAPDSESAGWHVTTVTLLALAVAFYLLPWILDLAAVYPFESLCGLLRTTCMIGIGVWAYVRITGNWLDVGDLIDTISAAIWDRVLKPISRQS